MTATAAAAAGGGERQEIEMLITSLETQRDRPALSVAAVQKLFSDDQSIKTINNCRLAMATNYHYSSLKAATHTSELVGN